MAESCSFALLTPVAAKDGNSETRECSKGPTDLASPRKRIGRRLDTDDRAVWIVMAENLPEIRSVGGHRFRSRLA
jgi:hypothetical protein